jgi:hypothetical protein
VSGADRADASLTLCLTIRTSISSFSFITNIDISSPSWLFPDDTSLSHSDLSHSVDQKIPLPSLLCWRPRPGAIEDIRDDVSRKTFAGLIKAREARFFACAWYSTLASVPPEDQKIVQKEDQGCRNEDFLVRTSSIDFVLRNRSRLSTELSR